MRTAGLPEGYRAVDGPGVSGFAWEPAAAWLESVVRGGDGLDAWATDHGAAELGGGRASVRSIIAPVRGPDQRERWACRSYRRGGLVAHALGSRYLRIGSARPIIELVASAAARARGVRTPAVVAGAMYPSGPFYRADLVTELVPGATLAARLFDESSTADVRELLGWVGRLVRSLEDARVLHRDLNAGNIVLTPGPEAALPWALDLDRCRILPSNSRAPGHGMRRRLERSLDKLGRRHRRPLGARAWEALHAGYEEHP